MTIVRILLLAVFLWPVPALALSCVSPQPDAMPGNELIAKARVTAIADQWFSDDKTITFEIISLYRAPTGMKPVIKASWSHFYQTWGPQLALGQVGEFLFDHKLGSDWVYSGPGGCNYVSETAWEKLRAGAVSPTP